MEAPKPISYSFIKKELTSEQGQRCTLQISFTNHKFEFIVDKKGKMFNDRFKKEYSLNQIQENKYFILFEKPEEILEELSQKIDSKNPILAEAAFVYSPITHSKGRSGGTAVSPPPRWSAR